MQHMSVSQNRRSCSLLVLVVTLLVLSPALNRGAAPAPDRPKYRFILRPTEAVTIASGGKYVAGNLDKRGNFVPDPDATHAKALIALLHHQGISIDPKIVEQAQGVVLLGAASTTDPEMYPCYEFRSGYLIEGSLVLSGFRPKVGSKVITMDRYLEEFRPMPQFEGLSREEAEKLVEKMNKDLKERRLSLPIYNLPGRIEEVKKDDKKEDK
jgi:hypothetical protein